MRIEVRLADTGPPTRIPISYNYYITSLIYEVISRSSRDYADFLHDEGYQYQEESAEKKFKLFTYSQLYFGESEVSQGKLISQSGKGKFFISSPIREFVEHLADGLLDQETVEIAGEKLEVDRIKRIDSPQFGGEMNFLCLSPIVASTMKEKDGELRTYYYRYGDEKLGEALLNNLEKKYYLVHGKEPESARLDIEFDREYVSSRDGRVSKLIDFKGPR